MFLLGFGLRALLLVRVAERLPELLHELLRPDFLGLFQSPLAEDYNFRVVSDPLPELEEVEEFLVIARLVLVVLALDILLESVSLFLIGGEIREISKCLLKTLDMFFHLLLLRESQAATKIFFAFVVASTFLEQHAQREESFQLAI